MKIAQRLEGGRQSAGRQALRPADSGILETQDARAVDLTGLEEPTIRTRTISEQRKQLAARRTLSELARSIAAVLDLDKVLNQVVEAHQC
jgi:hypothetical protein